MEQDLQKQIDEVKSELTIFKRHEHFFEGERLRIGSLQDDIDETEITLSDVTTNDVSSTKHGFAPKSPADATKFLNGAATPAYALVKDSDLSTSDVTTNNATNAKHGWLLKLIDDTAKFLRSDGTWVAPTAGGLTLAKGTIADNTNVAVSTGAGTNTDTSVTHGLGKTPIKITISARIFAIGNTTLTGGSHKYGYAIATYDTSSSDPILISGHIYIDKNDSAAGIATPRDLALTGTNAFLVEGTPSTDCETIKIQIISIGATTFTFRINGIVLGTPSATNSNVQNISWIAEG